MALNLNPQARELKQYNNCFFLFVALSLCFVYMFFVVVIVFFHIPHLNGVLVFLLQHQLLTTYCSSSLSPEKVCS